MDSGIAALLGALVGGSATFAASLFQSKVNAMQQRVRTATELAIKEHEFDLVIRTEKAEKRPYSLLSNYVAFHNAALKELETGKDNTPEHLEELAKKFGVKTE